ncbi:MAG: phosphotransferase [Dehalococcoidia bacterium]
MGKLAIPRTPEELTPEWLTSALREGGVIRHSKVSGVSQHRIGAGAGFLGQLAKVSLTYDRPEEGAPASLIAKLPAVDPGGREIGNLFRFYEREIRFYEEIAAGIDLRVPRCYYSAIDVPGDEYLMLLENMEPSRCGDEVAGCSAAECERAIDSLARFQAGWWDSPELARLDWMPNINDPVNHSTQPAYQQAWGPFLQQFGDEMSPKVRAVGEELQHHILELLDVLEPAPRTIVHGDFRGDNVFFGDGKTSDPFAVIDWQISMRGRGVFDVAYFLSTSCDPAIRKSEEMRLIRRWYDTACAGRSGYTFEDAFRDYRASLLFMHVYTVIALGSLDAANERGMKLFHEWLRRRAAAIEELDAGELMPH